MICFPNYFITFDQWRIKFGDVGGERWPPKCSSFAGAPQMLRLPCRPPFGGHRWGALKTRGGFHQEIWSLKGSVGKKKTEFAAENCLQVIQHGMLDTGYCSNQCSVMWPLHWGAAQLSKKQCVNQEYRCNIDTILRLHLKLHSHCMVTVFSIYATIAIILEAWGVLGGWSRFSN
jgi:hypothetical protein